MNRPPKEKKKKNLQQTGKEGLASHAGVDNLAVTLASTVMAGTLGLLH